MTHMRSKRNELQWSITGQSIVQSTSVKVPFGRLIGKDLLRPGYGPEELISERGKFLEEYGSSYQKGALFFLKIASYDL